ncbi:hypothetical protein ACWEFJ_23670 [Actinosynnema sp. NPDC004786]
MSGGFRVGELEVVNDLSPARWLVEHIHERPLDVGAIVPTGFAAYARLLHPAYEPDPATAARRDLPLAQRRTARRWSEVAAETGAVVHPLVQWERIVPTSYTYGDEPATGVLPVDYGTILADFLRWHTTSESCWFGVWRGNQPLLIPDGASTFRLPQREMYLLRGPLSGLVRNLAPEPLRKTVNLCWPEDEAWVLGIDVDLRSTYLAASRRCVTELLDLPGLEAYAVNATDSVTIESDSVNR